MLVLDWIGVDDGIAVVLDLLADGGEVGADVEGGVPVGMVPSGWEGSHHSISPLVGDQSEVRTLTGANGQAACHGR